MKSEADIRKRIIELTKDKKNTEQEYKEKIANNHKLLAINNTLIYLWTADMLNAKIEVLEEILR